MWLPLEGLYYKHLDLVSFDCQDQTGEANKKGEQSCVILEWEGPQPELLTVAESTVMCIVSLYLSVNIKISTSYVVEECDLREMNRMWKRYLSLLSKRRMFLSRKDCACTRSPSLLVLLPPKKSG